MIRYLVLNVCLVVCFPAISSQPSKDLQAVLAGTDEQAKLSALIQVADSLEGVDWLHSLDFANAAYDLAKTEQLEDQYYSVALQLSQSYYGIGNYGPAIGIGEEALSHADLPYERAISYRQLGKVYEGISEYETALDYQLKALELFQNIGDQDEVATTDNAIGFIYKAMRQFEKAIGLLQKSVKIYEEKGDFRRASKTKFNIALMTMEMDRHAEAIPMFRSSMEGIIESDDKHQYSIYYNNLANCFEKLLHMDARFYDSSLYYGHKSLALKRELKNYRGIANANNTLAATYERASDYTQSRKHALEALRIADSLGYKPIKRNALAYLITAELGLDRIDQTNDHFESYIDVVEEISNESFSRTLAEMSTKYETEKHLAANEILLLDADVHRRYNWLLTIGSIVLLVSLIFVANSYYRLSLANKQLALDKKFISEQSHELTKLNELKSQFFANISHELRTPLTLIQGNTQFLLKSKKLNPQHADYLKKTNRNTKQLTAMVDDLLDLSRLELKKQKVNLEPMVIDHFNKRVFSAFYSMAESKSIRMNYETALDGPVAVLADESKYEKVLNNLIYNAFKFTTSGGEIGIHTYQEGGSVFTELKDSGSGIKQEELPFLFDRFYQASNQSAQTIGTGLGLAISKEFMDLMGGSIEVESVLNQGTTFRLRLPITSQKPAPGIALEEDAFFQESETNGFDGLVMPTDASILVVEDNPELRDFLESILKDHFKVSMAKHGRDALEQLKVETPDVILSDVMMPEMNGWELVEALRGDPSLTKIPVILLTAISEGEERMKGLRLGVDDYIIKPFDTDELIIRLTNLINNLRVRLKWARESEPGDEVKQQAAQHNLILAIRDFVHENIDNKVVNVPQLALHVGMSERQLYRKTTEAVGMPPAKLIVEIRLQYARDLLISKRFDKLAQIAGAVGFDSSAHFAKLYFERFGKKPIDYFS